MSDSLELLALDISTCPGTYAPMCCLLTDMPLADDRGVTRVYKVYQVFNTWVAAYGIVDALRLLNLACRSCGVPAPPAVVVPPMVVQPPVIGPPPIQVVPGKPLPPPPPPQVLACNLPPQDTGGA